jgi:hypothetical protein
MGKVEDELDTREMGRAAGGGAEEAPSRRDEGEKSRVSAGGTQGELADVHGLDASTNQKNRGAARRLPGRGMARSWERRRRPWLNGEIRAGAGRWRPSELTWGGRVRPSRENRRWPWMKLSRYT